MNTICYYLKRNCTVQYNEFSATTSMSGFKFIGCGERKITKLFWFSILIVSLYAVIVICFGFYDQYENKAILTVLETIEQGSTMPYPSVYLCLGYPLNPQKLRQMKADILRTRNISNNLSDLEGVIQAAVRFQRSTRPDPFNVDDLFKYDLDITRLENYLPQLYYQIDELFTDCQLQGRHYRCRSLFKPLETSPGFCFVFNSIYTKRNLNEYPNRIRYYKFSELDDDWTIRFTIPKIDTSLLIFLKDPRDLLAMTDFPSYVWHPSKNISKYGFTINNHYAEHNVRTLRQSQRKCINSDEVFPYTHLRRQFSANFYSRGLCLSYCHAMRFYQHCKCFPFNMMNIIPDIAKKLRICALKDVRCFEKQYSKVRQSDCVRCLSNCNYTEYISRPEIRIPGQLLNIDQQVKSMSVNDDSYELSIDLEYWPILQHRTLVIFSTTEFIISLMGLAGLFMGTSLLAAVEAVYVLFVRYLCSYYVNWDYLESEFRKIDEKERARQIPCIDMSLTIKSNR